jgi:hypothetical protein
LLRESLGIMSIGKSVLELPSTLASFDVIYQRYLQELKVLDDIDEEIVSTDYVRNHERRSKDAQVDLSTFFKQRLDR